MRKRTSAGNRRPTSTPRSRRRSTIISPAPRRTCRAKGPRGRRACDQGGRRYRSGTRVGVPNLLRVFEECGVKATFLFSLGPDNTGRAIKRIFRPGFFKKASRTNVVGVYGLRTLMNGVLLPGPHIGRRNEAVMRDARD